MKPQSNTPRSRQKSERREAIASAFLAFAAMMKETFGVSKEVAVLGVTAAYDTNEGEDGKAER